jgi:hypothetical protein
MVFRDSRVDTIRTSVYTTTSDNNIPSGPQ